MFSWPAPHVLRPGVGIPTTMVIPIIGICYLYFILNSPVFYNLTPLVPEGTEHRLGGLHPGAPPLFSSVAARVRPRHTVPVGTGRPVRGR